MDWLSALQNVPVVGAAIALAFLLITTFANGVLDFSVSSSGAVQAAPPPTIVQR